MVSPHKCQTRAVVFDLVGMQTDVTRIFSLSPYPDAFLETIGLHQKSIYSLIYHHVAAMYPTYLPQVQVLVTLVAYFAASL